MGWWIMGTEHLQARVVAEGEIVPGRDIGPLAEIYCGPMDDILFGFVQAYGEHAGEILYDTAKAGALGFNQGVPVKCPETGQYKLLALLGDCGALLENMGLLFTENAL